MDTQILNDQINGLQLSIEALRETERTHIKTGTLQEQIEKAREEYNRFAKFKRERYQLYLETLITLGAKQSSASKVINATFKADNTQEAIYPRTVSFSGLRASTMYRISGASSAELGGTAALLTVSASGASSLEADGLSAFVLDKAKLGAAPCFLSEDAGNKGNYDDVARCSRHVPTRRTIERRR